MLAFHGNETSWLGIPNWGWAVILFGSVLLAGIIFAKKSK